jgi:hypothetical protein
LRVTRGISIAAIALVVGQFGLLRAIHGPTLGHSAPHAGVSRYCIAGWEGACHVEPGPQPDAPSDSGDHRDCLICHLIAQSAVTLIDPALPPVDRTALPPQQLWLVHILADSQDVHSPIGARAPPLA